MIRSDWLWLIAYMATGAPAAVVAWGAFYWSATGAKMAVAMLVLGAIVGLVFYALVIHRVRQERRRGHD